MARIVVTGYAGFIGSNLTRMLLSDEHVILGIDCQTYAARPMWVWDALKNNDERFVDAKVDIRDFRHLAAVLEDFKPDQVYHLAAESHVCRSIEGPRAFAETNFMGTFNLLEALRRMNFQGRLVHISTDEAFGELGPEDPPFHEKTPIAPRSPYSASKAASDLMVKAYAETYNMNCIITRCTNNYGPNQHEEKLIPRAITRILNGEAMTLYGDGSHSRDWIYVDDHCRALMTVMERGKKGELYCIGSGFERSNAEVIHDVANAIMSVTRQPVDLKVEYTNDRPTDDHRYAVCTSKIRALGWQPSGDGVGCFSTHLRSTARWYLENHR